MEDGRWIRPQQSILIDDLTIPDGMIYVSRSLSAPDGSTDPCLINLSLPISLPGEKTRKKVGNFPSYSDLSKEGRRTYLSWLSEGRLDPNIDIGYVLIFLYGLERRVAIDYEDMLKVGDEWSQISAEVERLLGIYGHKSGTFANAAVHLWGWLNVTCLRDSKLYELRIPKYSQAFEFPIFIQVALGQVASDNIPLSKELALAWVKSDPRLLKANPTIRFDESFDVLFMSTYSSMFGAGMKVAKGRVSIEASYSPTSVAWRRFMSAPRTINKSMITKGTKNEIAALDSVCKTVQNHLVTAAEAIKDRQRPYFETIAKINSNSDRILIFDGTYFQHPKYLTLPARLRGESSLNDLHGFVMSIDITDHKKNGVWVFVELQESNQMSNSSREEEPAIRLLLLLGWRVIKVAADAVNSAIAALAAESERQGCDTGIITNESSLIQCVTEHISVVNLVTGKRYNRSSVLSEFGVCPAQLPALWSLTQDSKVRNSDAFKIGAKTAAKLLSNFKTLKDLIAGQNSHASSHLRSIEIYQNLLTARLKLLTIEPELDLREKMGDCSNFQLDLKVGPTNVHSLARFYADFKFRHYLLLLSLDYFERWVATHLPVPSRYKGGETQDGFKFVVYRIRNRISKKVYFGSTNDIKTRWSTHKREINKNSHPNININKDIGSFGPESFEFKIVSRHETKEAMLAREQLYISMFYGRGCYNYAKYVEMEHGLPGGVLIGAKHVNYHNYFSRSPKLSGSNAGRKGYGQYLSIHAAAKDLRIPKRLIKLALLGDNPVVNDWVFLSVVELEPNMVGNYSKRWRPINRIESINPVSD